MKQYTITVEDQPYPGRTVWLCPGTGKGDGSAIRPFRVQSPDDFDNLIKGYHGDNHKGPVAFRLMPGEYFTRGCWNHIHYATLWEGDCLIGSTDAIIKLEDPFMETDGQGRPDVHVLSVGSDYHRAGRNRVENIIIEGKTNIPDGFTTAGIRLYGNGMIVRNVDVTGLCGSLDPVQTPGEKIALEAFGISFGFGDGVVETCEVRSIIENDYLSAFSACSSFAGVVFSDCIATARQSHAAFTVYGNTSVRNCKSTGFGYGIYNDSQPVLNAWVTGGSFECGRVGVGIVSPNGDHKCGIYVRDAYFRAPDVLLELIGKDGMFDDILLDSCRYEYGKTGKATLFSTDSKDVSLIRFRNCVVPDQLRVNNPNKVPYSVEGMMSWSGKRFMDTKPQGLTATVEEV